MTRLRALFAALLLLGVLAGTVQADELTFRTYARATAVWHGVDPGILECLAWQESRWDPRAVSSRGAIGLVQIMPQFHPTVNPWRWTDSLDYAAASLAAGLDEFGRYDQALAAWNAGSGAVRMYGGMPPYYETRLFVRNILTCAVATKETE